MSEKIIHIDYDFRLQLLSNLKFYWQKDRQKVLSVLVNMLSFIHAAEVSTSRTSAARKFCRVNEQGQRWPIYLIVYKVGEGNKAHPITFFFLLSHRNFCNNRRELLTYSILYMKTTVQINNLTKIIVFGQKLKAVELKVC